MALRAVIDHPKFAHLKSRLKLGKAAALGYLECVWHFTARFTPRGNIGKYADTAIESWAEWDGESGTLMGALVEAGWLEQNDEFRLVVHDWAQYADEIVNTTLARNCEKFCDGTLPKAGRLNQHERERFRQWSAMNQPQVSQESASLSINSAATPKPVPEPVLYIPPKPLAADTAAARLEEPEDPFRVAAETFDLSDEERQQAWDEVNGKGPSITNGTPKKSLLSPEVETVLDQVGRKIHARHPAIRRCGSGEVKKQLRAIARRFPAAKRVELLHQVDKNHEGWCASPDWQKDDGQYSKGLDNWLSPTKERYLEAPPQAPQKRGSDDRNEYGEPRLMM